METAGIYFDIEDREYFDRLEGYIRLNFPRFLKVCREQVDSFFVITDYLNKRNSKNIISIKETGGDIQKFQRASDICIELVNLIYGDKEVTDGHSRKSPHTICVTSAVGGAGKTKISLSLAKHAVNSGYKVLYINADHSSTGEISLPKSAGNGLTRLQYYLYKNKKPTETLLKDISCPAVQEGYDCIVNVSPSPNCIINTDVVDSFFNAVALDEFHDYIFIDFPSHMSDSLIRLMQGADKGVLICSNSNYNQREQKFQEFLATHCDNKYEVVRNYCADNDRGIPRDENNRPGELFNKAISDLFKMLGG